MPSNKSFCIRPWTQACVRTNGDITLCCRSTDVNNYNLKSTSIDQWWTSDYLASIRKEMLNGQLPSVCNLCQVQEQQGAVSLRQKANQEYKIYEQYAEKMLAHYNYPTPAPIEIELQLTNLCNLKCLMCNEDESSTLYAENKVLKISKINQADYSITSEEVASIREWLATKPKRINLRGGEPMIVPEIKQLMLWAIENNLLGDTEVHITTNLTKLDSDWINILTACKHLRLMVSVEATAGVYEYIRYGGVWSEVEANIARLAEIKDHIVVHATVQNLNILYVHDLVNWCRQNNLAFSYELLLGPEIFTLNSLPSELIARAQQQLIPVLPELAELLPAVEFNSRLWQLFKEEINLRDRVRHTSIINALPELKEYWNA